VNIRHNYVLHRFEAEFTPDFAGDLAAVKAAGFKTDGPPAWIWHTSKISVLNKLRENKPASGLTITPDGLEIYQRLAEQEQKNAEVKKQWAEAKKKAKKEQKSMEQEVTSELLFPPGKDYIIAEDLPFKSPFISEMPPIPRHKGPWCHICGQPVYPQYEKISPPTCLYCEKMLDKVPVV
jgi:hypothetical protein